MVTQTVDHTLYAHWQPKEVTVYFNANGGSTNTSSKRVRIGSTYGTLPTPSRNGSYDFDGWYVSGVGYITANSTVTLQVDHTASAQWTKKYRKCECCGDNYYECPCTSTICSTCGKCTNHCSGHYSGGSSSGGSSGGGSDSGGSYGGGSSESSGGGSTSSQSVCPVCRGSGTVKPPTRTESAYGGDATRTFCSKCGKELGITWHDTGGTMFPQSCSCTETCSACGGSGWKN